MHSHSPHVAFPMVSLITSRSPFVLGSTPTPRLPSRCPARADPAMVRASCGSSSPLPLVVLASAAGWIAQQSPVRVFRHGAPINIVAVTPLPIAFRSTSL